MPSSSTFILYLFVRSYLYLHIHISIYTLTFFFFVFFLQAKARGSKLPRVSLAVSLQGIRMTDLTSEEELLRISIYRYTHRNSHYRVIGFSFSATVCLVSRWKIKIARVFNQINCRPSGIHELPREIDVTRLLQRRGGGDGRGFSGRRGRDRGIVYKLPDYAIF